ncbi:MAG: nitronate monooxygenase [Gammaproteobacteria bacterium]|nr:nitronate monooxygenase [Gammaproteobacteria bacterium]
MISTRLTARLRIRHPVLNAPMALVAGWKLAAAVTRAGGVGLLGGGYAGILGAEPILEDEYGLATGTRIGIGFITWALAQAPELLDRALALNPACVFLSFTDPALFARKILDAKVPLICQAQTLAHLARAVDVGADIVVAQGTEAGGHGGSRATFPFVPEAADYLAKAAPSVLLLAAGGIADGRGLAAALLLGADGVVVGSRFWAAEEVLTPTRATDRAIVASGDDTVRTTAIDALRDVPLPSEFSFRVIKNKLTDAWVGRDAEAAQALRKAGSLRFV